MKSDKSPPGKKVDQNLVRKRDESGDTVHKIEGLAFALCDFCYTFLFGAFVIWTASYLFTRVSFLPDNDDLSHTSRITKKDVSYSPSNPSPKPTQSYPPLSIPFFDVELTEYLKSHSCSSDVGYLLFKDLVTAPTHCGKAEVCVVSLALWGSDRRYINDQTLLFIRQYSDIFVGWEIWIYTNEDTPLDFREKLERIARVIIPETKFHGRARWNSVWRYLPIFNSSVTRMISRDCDSAPSMRDWGAVYEWIRSEKPFMREADHPAHNGHGAYPFMAGMVGMKPSGFNEDQRKKAFNWLLDQKFYSEARWKYGKEFNDDSLYGVDQIWLDFVLSDIFSPETAVCFDSHYCSDWIGKATVIPYPIPLTKCNYFLGSNAAYWGKPPEKANPKCIHPEHPNWIYG